MRSLIIQPAGNQGARSHYTDTILDPVPIDTIKQYVDDEVIRQLGQIYKSDEIPTWGFTPGGNNVNVGKWNKVLPGDVVLFLKNKEVFASATVSLKTHSVDLAAKLWGHDAKNQTWEYIYFLDEVQQQKIPYDNLNGMLGYSPNNNFQQSLVLDNSESDAVIQLLDMDSLTYQTDTPTTDEYYEAVEPKSDAELDVYVNSKRRTEQSYLRAVNFKGKKFVECGICKREFPVAFLVAAHIKKRSECNDEERRDFNNITMPMCKFGCDELYENGYIGVSEKVFIVEDKNFAGVVLDYLKQIDGNSCDYWNENTIGYFKWHNERMKLVT
jgi:hypothetical protein